MARGSCYYCHNTIGKEHYVHGKGCIGWTKAGEPEMELVNGEWTVKDSTTQEEVVPAHAEKTGVASARQVPPKPIGPTEKSIDLRKKPARACTKCGEPAIAKGLCRRCYQRERMRRVYEESRQYREEHGHDEQGR